MARWRFTQTYRSSYGAGVKGDEVELDDEVAAAIERDAPGTLVAVKAVETPPATRQVTRTTKRAEG